jgi:hypothetical protein
MVSEVIFNFMDKSLIELMLKAIALLEDSLFGRHISSELEIEISKNKSGMNAPMRDQA